MCAGPVKRTCRMRKRLPAPAKFDRRPAAERAREALAEEQRRSKTFSGLTVGLVVLAAIILVLSAWQGIAAA